MTRSKWHHQTEPIRTGDLVFLVDELHPRNTWKRGFVSDVHFGPQHHSQAKMDLNLISKQQWTTTSYPYTHATMDLNLIAKQQWNKLIPIKYLFILSYRENPVWHVCLIKAFVVFPLNNDPQHHNHVKMDLSRIPLQQRISTSFPSNNRLQPHTHIPMQQWT
ncbi:hypothetical protein LAZ67_13000304 [Cordylochernes scorpioides]|uniref:DUF5641 domain-containing protein n=1 Tax=Cordylochernes scorpioides TaxID=51811 RepID=A0ABY6L2S8_9ARAC|nr:hypothetical protein LAZ67_13000304 [Cordylochernes scorpioides]